MKISYLLLLASVLTMAACSPKKEAVKTENRETIPVKVIELGNEDAEGLVEVSGQFTTDDDVYLSFKADGIVNKIFVKEGDAVTKGQILATLDLTEINAQVSQYKLGHEKARRDYERARNLYKDSVATLEQLQNAQTGYELATQQLEAALFNQSHSKIVATSNGFVLKKMASEGQLLRGGTPVLQTNGAGTGQWLLKVALSDRQWAQIKINDAATVTTANGDNRTWKGRVIRKAEGVDPQTGLLTADIEVKEINDAKIASGMFGKAAIAYSKPKTKDSSTTFTLPYDAVVDGDGSTGYVYITNDNRTAHKTKVTIEKLLKDKVIISDGLQGVKAVVVSGSAYLSENSSIQIIP